MVGQIPVPVYQRGAVANLEDSESAAGGLAEDDAAAEQTLQQLLESLQTLASSPQNRGLVPADFEKVIKQSDMVWV